jgi:hypothetical protein
MKKFLGLVLCGCLLGAPGVARETERAVERVVAVPAGGELLSEEEARELEAREEAPGAEVKGGALSNQQLTYIVIALAAAVLVLVLK